MSKQTDIAFLLQEVVKIANKHYDGHFAIFSFTTHFKAGFGTPDLDSGAGREQIRKRPGFPTLQSALADLILDPKDFDGDGIDWENLPF